MDGDSGPSDTWFAKVNSRIYRNSPTHRFALPFHLIRSQRHPQLADAYVGGGAR
jgi:hypothetical protein